MDALVGVGMTGICSGSVLKLNLEEAAKEACATNELTAEAIGINKAARVTTVKPSGTSSCVLGSSSGIHGWHDEYYIRRMQLNSQEALVPFFLENHPELITEYEAIPGSYVLEFPQKAPKGAVLRNEESAVDFLDRTHKFNMQWVREGHRDGANTNNVSATCSIKKLPQMKQEVFPVRDADGENTRMIEVWTPELDRFGHPIYAINEWPQVGEWMWKNREFYNGLSVLPYDGGTYKQAPFETISKSKYERLMKSLATVDLTRVTEVEDTTSHTQELACAGGACEV
jgi:ribonucleoside-triphosphate reductase